MKASAAAAPPALPKHEKYHKFYRPNDIFWGIGVEHETYLESLTKEKIVTIRDISSACSRERYSVNYLTAYRAGVYAAAMEYLAAKVGPTTKLRIPILMNAHSFQHTDIYGEHETLYVRGPSKVNPRYSGRSLFAALQEAAPAVFKDKYDVNFLFDGDTFEFTTLGFYNATTEDVVHELKAEEDAFIEALNVAVSEAPVGAAVREAAPFCIARKNYGLVSYMTNPAHSAMFNNGTIHINITLPTRLGPTAEIDDIISFTEAHRRLAVALQWFEPFLIAVYCSADPFSSVPGLGASAGSQRLAVSRYIGIGTYDTDAMERGKILMRKRESDDICGGAAYTRLDMVGLDINFNKHYNHGIEFRILDAIPAARLEKVLDECVLIANFSQAVPLLDNPRRSALWTGLVEGVMREGARLQIDIATQEAVFSILGIKPLAIKETLSITDMYVLIMQEFAATYKKGVMSEASRKRVKATVMPAAAASASAAEVPVVSSTCCLPICVQMQAQAQAKIDKNDA
jgi:hypothetical protein